MEVSVGDSMVVGSGVRVGVSVNVGVGVNEGNAVGEGEGVGVGTGVIDGDGVTHTPAAKILFLVCSRSSKEAFVSNTAKASHPNKTGINSSR